MKAGEKIKELRKEKKLTLSELSKLSKVAVATLSRMENNIMTGTVDAYASICKGFGISLSEFFEGIDSEPHGIKIKDSAEVAISSSGYSVLNLFNNPKAKMQTLLISIKPKFFFSIPKSNIDSEKFIYILEGFVVIQIANQRYPLKKNSSAYFRSSVEHTLSNTANKEAKIITIEC